MNVLMKILLKAAALYNLKKKGEQIYHSGLNTARRSLRYLFFIFILSQIFICGLALTLYSTYQLLPLDEAAKQYCLLATGLIFVLVPLALVLWGTSKRTWKIKY